MDRDKHRQLTQLVWLEHLRSWGLTAVLGGVIIAAFFVVSMNVPLSSRQTMCDFQRLSYVSTTRYSWSRPVAFCDLQDGKTVMFRVPNGWVPPVAGTALQIFVDELVFGVNYRPAPTPER